MCGIFCAIKIGHPFGERDFARFVTLTDLVRYRGPDDGGYLALNAESASPSAPDRFHVFLGNRRLSILDLSSAGHQPMTDEKGRWITYNGEIFNYLELREELEAQGRRFKTSTDTEVILQVYDAYGESGFEKLNGMWAFALVDGPGRRVVLSRDRFSIKPLYRLQAGDELYFASEIKQLSPLLARTEANPEVMSAYLWQGLLDHTSDTFFAGISRVAPRTNIIITLDTGATTERVYWNFASPDSVPDGQAVEKFRELFLDSVKIRLRSDVPVGVLLSGGLDSSTIAVVSNDLLQERLESFSVISEQPEYSEQRFINVLCDANHIPNRQMLFRNPDVLDALEATLYHSDEPFGGFSVIAQYKMLEMIKRDTNLTVLLSGQGGDEILLGYKKFLFFHAKELAGRRQYASACGVLLASFLRGTVVRQFQLGEARRYMPFWKNGENGHFICAPQHPFPIWKCADMRSRQIEDVEHYSVPALTHYEDRNSTAHSLEVRHPFLDHRLVEFSLNLDTKWKLRRGWTKHILREAFPEVPALIRWRKDKKGFTIPEEVWLRQDLSKHIRTVFRRSTLSAMGFIDDHKFLEYYDKFQQGRVDISATDISRVLIAEAWASKTFGAGSRTRQPSLGIAEDAQEWRTAAQFKMRSESGA